MNDAPFATYSGPARNDTAVFVTVDRNYQPYALFLLNQIARAHPERDFDFCILSTEEMAPHPLMEALDVRVCQLNVADVTKNFALTDRIPLATYLRLFGARAFAEDYRRLLYLDVDIMYIHGDLQRLINADIGDHVLAGARDFLQFRHPTRIPRDMRGMGLGHFKYLSAGVQLIDTKRYNAAQVGERAVALAAEQPDKMKACDQTAINVILQGNWAELSPVWNWLYGFRTLYFTEMYYPAFLHFAGWRKPWSHLTGEFPRKYAEEYREFFAVHYPDMAKSMGKSAPPSAARFRHLRFLIKHIVDFRRFTAGVDVFENDFDIKL